MRRLKQNSTRELWKRYPGWLRHHFWKEHTFWSDGFPIFAREKRADSSQKLKTSGFSQREDINQQTLADLAEVGINTIVAIERGTGNPSIKTLKRITYVLGLEIKLV